MFCKATIIYSILLHKLYKAVAAVTDTVGDDDGSDSMLVHEMAVESLIDMQQREALHLLLKGSLDSINDVIFPTLYSHKFQIKVSQYLVEGGLHLRFRMRLSWHMFLLEVTFFSVAEGVNVIFHSYFHIRGGNY